jgi:porin
MRCRRAGDICIITAYQHIWNPFSAQFVTDEDHADIFLTRLTVAW